MQTATATILRPKFAKHRCFKSSNPTRNELKEAVVTVEKLKRHKDHGIVGLDITLLALKNTSSYMIGTWSNGFKVIEYDSEVYSGKLPVLGGSLNDIIYVESLDCYLMYIEGRIYRKDIDSQPPFIFKELQCGFRPGAVLKWSEINQRLIVIKGGKNVAVIDPYTKDVEIEIKDSLGGNVMDFRFVGEMEDKVVTVTEDGYVNLFKLNYGQKSATYVTHYKLDLLRERQEEGFSIAVCDRAKYLLVEIGDMKSGYCSRMIVLKINNGHLIKKASVDRFDQKLRSKLALECCGYIDQNILWVGFSMDSLGLAQIFEFDVADGELRELEKKRVPHGENEVYKVSRVDNQYYYTGMHGRVMKLGFHVCLTNTSECMEKCTLI